ncbi:hypothetical protein EE612_013132, partial [Oryza sativa]
NSSSHHVAEGRWMLTDAKVEFSNYWLQSKKLNRLLMLLGAVIVPQIFIKNNAEIDGGELLMLYEICAMIASIYLQQAFARIFLC